MKIDYSIVYCTKCKFNEFKIETKLSDKSVNYIIYDLQYYLLMKEGKSIFNHATDNSGILKRLSGWWLKDYILADRLSCNVSIKLECQGCDYWEAARVYYGYFENRKLTLQRRLTVLITIAKLGTVGVRFHQYALEWKAASWLLSRCFD